MARDVAVTALVVAGVAVQLLAIAGVFSMRTALDRLHYTSASSLAVVCLCGAVVVRDPLSLIGIKAVLVAAFLLVSSPAIVNATARAIHERAREGR